MQNQYETIKPTEKDLIAELLKMPGYLKLADLGIANKNIELQDEQNIGLLREEIQKISEIEIEDEPLATEPEEDCEVITRIKEKDIKLACPEMVSQFLERSK